MLWSLTSVESWQLDYEESRGRRLKRWIREPGTHVRWLRKSPIERSPSEVVIEHTILQLAQACGLPAAESRLATWTTSRGIIVRSFLKEDETLESGASVIRGHRPTIVLNDTKEGRSAHTPESAIAAAAARDSALIEPFLAMLLFDAWVGNSDRHSENWSIIVRGDNAARLAPIYDVSACFGSNLQDDHALLVSPVDRSLNAFVANCQSGFGDGQRQILMSEVVRRLTLQPAWPGARARLLPKFRRFVDQGILESYFRTIPDDWLSSPKKRLGAYAIRTATGLAGATRVISRLFVLWRTPDEARRRFIVGQLWRERGTFFFGYAADISQAESHGFRRLAEFPEPRSIERPYDSEGYLFPTFAQRIPSPRRPDYSELMRQWQVDHVDDHFEVLARSGGILATDGIELAEYRALDDPITEPLRMRVAGTRFYDGKQLAAEGAQVRLVPEPDNTRDPNAVKIVLGDGVTLGFVPYCYAELLRVHLAKGELVEAKLLRPIVLQSDPRRWQLEVRCATSRTP